MNKPNKIFIKVTDIHILRCPDDGLDSMHILVDA